jgi:hypothetical protein
MFTTFRLVALIVTLSFIGGIVLGQRPRTASQDSPDASTAVPTPPPAPPTVNAKYEGGVFGYTKKMNGTLNFDDPSQRLVFRDKAGKEILFVPYSALMGAYADTHSVQPAAATVASHLPVPFIGAAGLIKTKVRYLTLQYSDPDSQVAGTTSFKLDNKDILDSVLFTLAGKAGLIRRGEVFVRKVS